MKAWYFAGTNNRLRYDDEREIVIGETHSISTEEQELELCGWGLHASSKISDALSYAPGPIVYRVELTGEIIKGDDKAAATHRKYLWGFDASDLLRDFSRRCALDVIHLWDAPPVVREFLGTGNEDLRAAAKAAAWDAARAAAWTAAIEKYNRRLTSMVIAEHKRLQEKAA